MNNENGNGRMCYDSQSSSAKHDYLDDDPGILALVRLIARRAAEEDYQELLRVLTSKEGDAKAEKTEVI